MREREKEKHKQKGARERERESQGYSTLSVEPDVGFNFRTLKS